MKDFAAKYHAEHLGNCAESVAAAWAEAHGKDIDEVKAPFKACGAGRAEGGYCGALYAAMTLRPECRDEIAAKFKLATGGFSLCKEIRPAKRLSCNECVATAAGILDSLEKA